MPPPDNVPDAIANTESASSADAAGVSTEFEPNTGRTLQRAALLFAVILLICFVVVKVIRVLDEHSLAKASQAALRAPPPVDVTLAKAAGADQQLVLPAQTAAWFETTIYARVNGYVAHWSADIGDHVKKGQVLATIETPDLDAELAAARAQLQASQAQVTARKAEAEFSKSTNERWRDSPKGVVSDQERESKKADYESSEARLYAADAQQALDKAKVDQYVSMTQFKQVIAPFDGTITERKIDVGNLVTAGSTSSTTSLYSIAQTDPLRIFVDVPQSAADQLLQVGLPAQIRATDSSGAVFAGKIARSAQSINPQARTMRVEVDMPNQQHALLPGMYVNVAFDLKPVGLVEVPAAALIYRPNGTQVAEVTGAGKVRFDNVTILRDNGNLVELGAGVEPGARLILNISSQIAAGQPVTVNSTDNAAPPVQAAAR